jgi:hypothetical protein
MENSFARASLADSSQCGRFLKQAVDNASPLDNPCNEDPNMHLRYAD